MTVSQPDFAKALLDPTRPAPAGLQDSRGHPSGKRFDVYRNNVTVSLIDALHSAFPVIAKLLGKENMDGLARLYLRSHPPVSPLMMHYGAEFPAFLAENEQLSHLGYLPDVARLDLAMRRSYHAADAAPVAADQLAQLSPDALMQSTVTLAPALELLQSDWPIYDIWRFNTEPDAPKPQPGPQEVAITRPGFDPQPQLLPPGGGAWIAALLNGAPLDAAQDAALATTPDFDLTACLTLLLQGDAIVALTPKG